MPLIVKVTIESNPNQIKIQIAHQNTDKPRPFSTFGLKYQDYKPQLLFH